MRHPPLHQLNPQRLCLIKPSALGDIVQSLPVLTALRTRWPEAYIAWVANRGLSGVLRGHPHLDEVIEFDRSLRGWGRITAMRKLAGQLAARQFDLAIDLQGLLRSGMMTLATRAPRRVGLATAREGATWAYTDSVAVSSLEQSAVSRYWLVAQALGCAGDPPAPRFGFTPALRNWAQQQLAPLPRPVLAIHAGAQWETKRWPPRHFAELARRAQTEFGAGVLLVGGPGESTLAEQIAVGLTGPVVNLAERTRLLELAVLLEAADMVCSGDTGPMHLAAAVGTPVVAVFTCTSPVRAGPYGSGHRVVATNVACAASYRMRCSQMVCMHELTPERVWPALQATLRESLAPRQGRAG